MHVSEWSEQIRQIRVGWKKEATALAARLSDAELEDARRELKWESDRSGHRYDDVIIYVNVLRAEHRRRRGSGSA